MAEAPPEPAPGSSASRVQTKETVQAKDPNSAKTCAMCHTEFYKEWNGRNHQQAWDNKLYQSKLAKRKKRAKTCKGCHVPQRVLARIGKKPKTRKDNLHEGVTCVSCHEHDGKIHGPFGAKTDAHKSEKNPLFSSPGSNGLCRSCHSTKIDVVLPVGRDFKNAGLAAKGKSCVGCHMPEIERHLAVSPVSGKPVGKKRKTRSHRILGPDDAEFCATAFELSVRKDGAQLELVINNGAGHRVPGLKIRAFHIDVIQVDADGKKLSKGQIKVDSENGLTVAESRAFPLPLASGTASVKVTINHYFEHKLVAKILEKTLPLK